MDHLVIAQRYVEIQLLLCAAFGIYALLGDPAGAWRKGLRPKQYLTIAYLVLIAAIALPFFPRGAGFSFQPPVQVWSASSRESKAPAAAAGALSISALSESPAAVPVKKIGAWLLVVAGFGMAIGAGQFARSVSTLRRVARGSFLIRKIGRVRILAHEHERVPFSFRSPRHRYVIVPTAWLARPADLRVAVSHELQHHRQGDTLSVYALELLKLLFFINPLAHGLARRISIFQEYACDENLVDRKKLSPRAYAGCLLRAAENSLKSHGLLAGTTGMAVSASGMQLQRRIEMMFEYQVSKRGRWLSAVLATVALAVLATAAYAGQGLVRDRRVTAEEARLMASVAASGTDFPVVMNEAVLEQLNRFLGTPDGRTYMREAIANMQGYSPMIERKLHEYGLPRELLAVPAIESKYRNYKPGHSAGLWMFIVTSAQHYGLRVDGATDERLNPELETDAAMRYLAGNHLRFRDWLLALLAYNAGESAVQQGIDAVGSRDAWKLAQAGYDGDRNYLAMVMATVIILKNPAALD